MNTWTVVGWLMLAVAGYRWITGDMQGYEFIVMVAGIQLGTGAILEAISSLHRDLKNNEET